MTDRELMQQEPVAKVRHDLEGHIGWNPKLTQLPDEGAPLYTSPPANANAGQRSVKPWVHATTWRGLTDDEIALICAECSLRTPCDIYYARAIEAKLREKNEHREKNA